MSEQITPELLRGLATVKDNRTAAVLHDAAARIEGLIDEVERLREENAQLSNRASDMAWELYPEVHS